MTGHDHHHRASSNIRLAFFLNLAFTVVEIIGGLWTNSVAILSDALHDLGDSIALGMAWRMERFSTKKGDPSFSFGYRRFSLLSAMLTSLILIIGSIYILFEAVGRMLNPERSNAEGMVLFAIAGIAVNGYAAWKVSKGGSLNERIVSWHFVEDVLGWVAVLIAGAVLMFREIHYLDPAISILITIYILYNVVKRLKETLFIFLQGVPAEIDIRDIELKIKQVERVQSVHDLHIWSMDGEHHVLTAHVKLERIDSIQQVLAVKTSIKHLLSKLPLQYVTIETEFDEETCFMDKK